MISHKNPNKPRVQLDALAAALSAAPRALPPRDHNVMPPRNAPKTMPAQVKPMMAQAGQIAGMYAGGAMKPQNPWQHALANRQGAVKPMPAAPAQGGYLKRVWGR